MLTALLAACPTRTPPDIPQATQAAEVPAPISAPAAEIVPLDPPSILRAPPGTPGHTVSTPAAAPKVAASKAKAAPKTAKPGVTEEEYATLAAQFYAAHVKCLNEMLDAKLALDQRAGRIQDFGNIRESGLCGYDYFDPATGRLPPYSP
jgi:hypothetical protein